MEKLFLLVLNMSLTGAYVILAICLVRLPLKKAPKIISYVLWGVAGFRLVIPFSIQSVVSLLPFKARPIPYDIGMQAVPRIDSGIAILNNRVSASLPAAVPTASVNPLQVWIMIGSYVWLIGIGIMIFYSFISIGLLRYRLGKAVLIKDNLYEADNLKTPFVIGIFRPKIYIPIGLSNEERHYIILHEQTHIKRYDHLVKMFAYFVLCLHWYNPFVWFAFVLMGADMEMSCDERVMKEMGEDIKKAYSLSLIRVAAGHRILNGSPLAFGEGGMKERIKNVLNFRKHSRVLIFAAVGLAAIVTVGFAVNRPIKNNNNDTEQLHINLIGGLPRIYHLEHPTDRQKVERIVSVILYGDGRVGDMTLLISSHLGYSNNSYTVDKEAQGNQYSITIYEDTPRSSEGKEIIARFKVIDDKTIELESASNAPFPEVGARYVYREEQRSTGLLSWTLMTIEELKGIAEQYKEDLTMDAFQGFVREHISPDRRSVQFYMYDRPYSLLIHMLEDGKIGSAELFQMDENGMGESIDIRYYDVDKFIEDGTKERTTELPSNLVIVPDFYPESPTGVYGGVVNDKDYQDIYLKTYDGSLEKFN